MSVDDKEGSPEMRSDLSIVDTLVDDQSYEEEEDDYFQFSGEEGIEEETPNIVEGEASHEVVPILLTGNTSYRDVVIKNLLNTHEEEEEMGEEDFEFENEEEENYIETVQFDWDEPDDQPIIGDSAPSEGTEELVEMEIEPEVAEEESVSEVATTVTEQKMEPTTVKFTLEDYAWKHKEFFEKFLTPMRKTICESDETVTIRFNMKQFGGPATDKTPPIKDMYGALLGISRVRPRVTFYPEEKVLIRADDQLSQDQVKLVSGGSTGKEPLFTEYVGRGMLSAAILGNATDGPTIGSVIRTIKEIYNEKGVLLVVRKSAEHRLIFGIALEQARIQGLEKIDMVMVGDDSYDHPSAPLGRRGMAGIALALKLAGALCLLGRQLKFVASAVRAAAFDMGTIAAITHPEVIIGATSRKIYETGEKFKGTLRDLVVEMMKYLLDPKRRYSLRIIPGRKYVVLVNSFRPQWPQLYRVADYMMMEMEARGLPVSRLYAASFVGGPSPGFSITILSDHGNHYAHLLDAPTDCVVWKEIKMNGVPNVVKIPRPDMKIYVKKGVMIKKAKAMTMQIAVEEVCRVFVEAELLLNWIDVYNKYGTQARCAAEAVHLASHSGILDYRHPFSCFLAISDTLSNNLPPTSGALYGLIFVAAAQAFAVNAEVGNKWVAAMKKARHALSAFERGQILELACQIIPLITKYSGTTDDANSKVCKELCILIEEIMVEVEKQAADVLSQNKNTRNCDRYSMVLWLDSVFSVTMPRYREFKEYEPSAITGSTSLSSEPKTVRASIDYSIYV